MRDLLDASVQVQKVFEEKRWKFCFIGGLAVQKWGEVRITQDIDLMLFTGLGHEERFIDALLEYFPARMANAREFAILNRVLLLRTQEGIDLDISCGAFPFEASAVKRARKVQVIPGIKLKLCSAEDLIVYKAFANRPIDWKDIEGIFAKRPAGSLDFVYVLANLADLVLLKEEPEIMSKMKSLIARQA